MGACVQKAAKAYWDFCPGEFRKVITADPIRITGGVTVRVRYLEMHDSLPIIRGRVGKSDEVKTTDSVVQPSTQEKSARRLICSRRAQIKAF